MASQKFRQCYLENAEKGLIFVTYLPANIVKKGKIISFKNDNGTCDLDKNWQIKSYSPEVPLDELIAENGIYKKLSEIC